MWLARWECARASRITRFPFERDQVRQLMTYTRQLDVLATSAGVIFSNTDRPELETNLIEDLLQQLSNQSDGKPPGSREPERAFAAWTLAHFTSTSSNDPDDPDSQKRVGDQKRAAIHEGFEIITKVLTDSKPASLIRRALKKRAKMSWIQQPVMRPSPSAAAKTVESHSNDENARLSSSRSHVVPTPNQSQQCWPSRRAAVECVCGVHTLYEFQRRVMRLRKDMAKKSTKAQPTKRSVFLAEDTDEVIPPPLETHEVQVKRGVSNTNSNETIQKRPVYLVFNGRNWLPIKPDSLEPAVSTEAELGKVHTVKVYRFEKPEEELVKERIKTDETTDRKAKQSRTSRLEKTDKGEKSDKELVCGELPDHIDVLSEVAKSLRYLTKQKDVLKHFASMGVHHSSSSRWMTVASTCRPLIVSKRCSRCRRRLAPHVWRAALLAARRRSLRSDSADDPDAHADAQVTPLSSSCGI